MRHATGTAGVCAILIVASGLRAQTTFGTILGSVKDPDGAHERGPYPPTVILNTRIEF